MSTIAGTELVERIWARDAVGLDRRRRGGVARLARRAGALLDGRRPALLDLADDGDLRHGRAARHGRLEPRAGGAPPHLRRRAPSTSSTRRIRRRSGGSRRARSTSARTLFVASSKSGGTIETRSHLDFFWERAGRRRRRASSRHRSRLGARGAGARAQVPGRRPRRAVDRRALLRAVGVRDAPGRADGRRRPPAARARGGDARGLPLRRRAIPGLELGLALGEGWRAGRDKVALTERRRRLRPLGGAAARRVDRQGGQGPRAGARATGPDVQAQEVRLDAPYELGQEFFRWEFATAVAGSLLGINPFDQPDVQAAKDRTSACSSAASEVDARAARARWTSCSRRGARASYVAILRVHRPGARG